MLYATFICIYYTPDSGLFSYVKTSKYFIKGFQILYEIFVMERKPQGKFVNTESLNLQKNKD